MMTDRESGIDSSELSNSEPRAVEQDAAGHSSGGDQALRRLTLKLWASAALIVAFGVLVYLNSFSGQFVFDDAQIKSDPWVRTLWPPWHAMFSRLNISRPLVGLSFAINYAVSGFDVWSYHLFNITVHLLAGLALFAVARRTLETPRLAGRFGKASTGIALSIALIWVVHPLQTESVTYIIQRAEAMMGLFYLLTLYCAIRGIESDKPGRWYAAAILCSIAGMATKPVMVTAPLIVIGWDLIFKSDSLKDTLRKRLSLYAGLASSWLVLIAVVIAAAPTVKSAGFGLRRITFWPYLLSQFGALVRYLRLSIIPYGLCLDYYLPASRTALEIIPYGLLIVGLGAGTLIALKRAPALGFLGLCFFLILAPTSSFLPLLDIAAEHRMYLPLAAVVALLVASVYRLVAGYSNVPRWVLPAVLAVAVAWLGSLTVVRNSLYHNSGFMWADVVEKAPWNPRAHCNLGLELYNLGQVQEATWHLEQAIELKSDMAEALNGLGTFRLDAGKPDEAIAYFERALAARPNMTDVNFNIGNANIAMRRFDEAASAYRREVQINPLDMEAWGMLGTALEQAGRMAEAAEAYQEGLRFKPNSIEMLCHLTLALSDPRAGSDRDLEGAMVIADRALELTRRQQPAVLDIAASVYSSAGRFDDAIAMAQSGIELARSRGDERLVEVIGNKLAGYRAGRPSR
jgi:protein O-mannosyl-transferase